MKTTLRTKLYYISGRVVLKIPFFEYKETGKQKKLPSPLIIVFDLPNSSSALRNI
jgi:hypothetical protein